MTLAKQKKYHDFGFFVALTGMPRQGLRPPTRSHGHGPGAGAAAQCGLRVTAGGRARASDRHSAQVAL